MVTVSSAATLFTRADRASMEHSRNLRVKSGEGRIAIVFSDRRHLRQRTAYAVDLPLEHDTGHLVDAAADFFSKTLDIGRRGVSGVNQEVGMLLRNHRSTSDQAAAPGGIDQPPCRLARRVCKGRA